MLEEMMDMVINKYGFESAATINFCKACEDIENSLTGLVWLFIVLMKI